MPYSIDKKLVVAVSSSAVFDMTAAEGIYRDQSLEAYREHQVKNVDVPFERGVAFPFLRRLLAFNKLYPAETPVEVIVLSRNDPETGLRFFRSCRHYDLDISRGAFLSGKSPLAYVTAFSASLFLSAHDEDVREALAAGLPAGLIVPAPTHDDASDSELRIAFDFDGVLADDESEAIFHASNDLDHYHQSELENFATPHNPGPLMEFISSLSILQQLEEERAAREENFAPALRVAIVTARGAPANERVVTSLNSWGVNALETFFLGGIEKKRVLEVLKPHIFFDDQLLHLHPTASSVPSVHIPFGIRNVRELAQEAPGA